MENFISNKGRGYRWAAFTFTMVIVFALIKFLFAFAHKDVGGHIAQALIALIGGIIIIVLPAYVIGKLVDKFKKEDPDGESDIHQLSSTKVVKPDVANLTKRDSLPSEEKIFDNPISKSETQKKSGPVEKIDDFYAQAWDEINDQNKTPDKALWAKAFADAQGCGSLAKANYLKLRVEKLSKEYTQNLTMERERQIKLMRQQDALALEKRKHERKHERQRQEIEMLLKDSKKIEGQSGDAFCIVCRNVSSMNGMFHYEPTDTYYHTDCLLRNEQPSKYDIAEIQRLSGKYENFKDTIISEVKKTLKTKEEIQILESQSRLPYAKLIELGSPGQLTDEGLSVFKLLIKEINKTLH